MGVWRKLTLSLSSTIPITSEETPLGLGIVSYAASELPAKKNNDNAAIPAIIKFLIFFTPIPPFVRYGSILQSCF
ncbi:hypothetical protein [Bacillus cereus]